MADSSSTESLGAAQRAAVLGLALRSIEHGLRAGRPLDVALDDCDPALRRKAAVFVTLHVAGELQGCIGTLEPVRPLAEEVARCAFAAAFEDPRFVALQRSQVDDLDIHVAVLSPHEPITYVDEADLLRQLRPGVDGVLLREEATGRQGTFLPAVWEKLPQPAQFVRHLKMKAGLDPDAPLRGVRAWRYTVEDVGEARPQA